VHNFLYNRHASTDLYVAPSTGFVRPDYAELAAVPPLAENGRDDPPKLGILVVDVTADGHTSRPVRSFGSTSPGQVTPTMLSAALDPDWKSPIGVTLRHGWATVTDFPTAGLDEFNRKQIRNDAVVFALWEARINNVRVPLADVCAPAGTQRLEDLTARGMRFSVFSAGIPDQENFDTVRSIAEDVRQWQIVVPPERFGDLLARIGDEAVSGIDLAIAPIVAVGPRDSTVHHFVAAGFHIENDPLLAHWLDLDADCVFTDLVFRLAWGDDVGDGVVRANTIARDWGRRAVVIIDLPRSTESSTFDDDEAVAHHVAAAARAAMSETDVAVFLDAFVDHDRGYYPRHCLIDRAFNPRPALYRLIEESSATSM